MVKVTEVQTDKGMGGLGLKEETYERGSNEATYGKIRLRHRYGSEQAPTREVSSTTCVTWADRYRGRALVAPGGRSARRR
jgi:hypothetical protein